MTGKRSHSTRGVLGLAVVSALAGCSSAPGSSTGASTPRYGGTLRVAGSTDIDRLDTASVYDGVTYTVERAFARQLVTYPATGLHSMPTQLVPDLATTVPTKANGGVTDNGTTYTFHLRDGVQWDTSPPRPVTSADVARGFERLCNPVEPSGALGYYQTTIAGMRSYCAAFLKVPGTVGAIRSFLTTHHITGVQTPDAQTVVLHLVQPANDFDNIMALPMSSAAPAEYLDYLPGSQALDQHTISDGPYRIADYRPGVRILLTRNPAWRRSTDPVRPAYVDRIDVDEGVTADAAALQLESGDADLQWDPELPTPALVRLLTRHDPRLMTYPEGSLAPYIVINLQSPDAQRATSRLAVRRAVEYAVDKSAIVQVNGGPVLNQPLDQVIPPGSVGHEPFNLYPTPSHKGDPAKARALLASAGYPQGVRLKLLYSTDAPTRSDEEVLQADLSRAGITVTPVAMQPGSYLLFSPSFARAGKWDLALNAWGPDWFGNNGRTTVQPLLDGASYGPESADYGDYDSPIVNRLINQALSAPSAPAAAAFWHQADLTAMRDAALVPLVSRSAAVMHSARVRHWRVDPVSWQGDVTALWLARSG